jgi:hypothetical protein
VSAINDRFGKGVTPENNVFVALLPAIGTGRDVLGDACEKELAALGGKPAAGLFVPNEDVPSKYRELQEKPWKAADAPEADAWVNANEACLKVAAEAVQRPRCWMPAVEASDGSINYSKHAIPVLRIAELFRLRAMRKLGSGDASGAWQDTLASRSLSQCLLQGRDLVEQLIGVQGEVSTQKRVLAILQDRSTDQQLAASMLETVRTFPRVPAVAELMQRQEIYLYPHTVQQIATKLHRAWEKEAGSRPEEAEKALSRAGLFFPDLERMATQGNEFFADLYREEAVHDARAWKQVYDAKRHRRQALFDAASADMKKEDLELMGGFTDKFMRPRAGETRDAYTDRLTRAIESMMTPNVDASSLDTERKTLELTPLACAIVLYRLDTGKYPDTLQDAGKRYGLGLPTGFWGREVGYQRTTDGFKLQVWGPGAETQKEAEKDGLIELEVKRS